MDKKSTWKPILVILLIIFAILYILPSFFEAYLPVWYNNLFPKRLKYGLDLEGGLALEYTVNYRLAIKDNISKRRQAIAQELGAKILNKKSEELTDADKKEIDNMISTKMSEDRYDLFDVIFDSAEHAEVLDQGWLDNTFPDYMIQDTGKQGDKYVVTLKMKDKSIFRIKDQVVKQAQSIISKRLESFGLADPVVRQSGDTNIEVQIPGLAKSQMEMVKQRIGQTAQLTFRIVDRSTDFYNKIKPLVEKYKSEYPDIVHTLEWHSGYLKAQKKSELVFFVKWLKEQKDEKGQPFLDDNHIIGYGQETEEEGPTKGREVFFRTYYLFSRIELTGDRVTNAYTGFQPNSGDPYVGMEFDVEGGRKFLEVTTQYEKEYMAIMLDEDVETAPVIKGPIPGGRAIIELGGGRSQQEMLDEAKGITTVLTHGAYKADVQMVYAEEVGPSLGHEAVEGGKLSIIIGSILVIMFMIFYYRWSGVIANIALILNILFIIMVLISFNSRLTLPGIAGIVLTIGMAVDANVLIFERIREELRSGKGTRAAVDAGYNRALWTILDSNITTAIAGLALLFVASGPIRGFAVTLLIGIVSSVITAVWFSQWIYNFLLDRGLFKKLSI